MTLRKVVLTIHLYLGLAAAIFLAILGLTGSIMAFENDIDHWMHPNLWYVTPGRGIMTESDLVSIAQNRYHSDVVAVQFPRASNLAQVMRMTDGTFVYVNPYDGTILGEKVGLSNTDRFIGWVHQIHLRLIPEPRFVPKLAEIGKTIVSFAGLILCLMVLSGVTLWWRTKRATINWKASWFKVFFDAHHVIGIAASLFLLIASLTGILIGFDFGERLIYAVTRSAPPARSQPSASVPIPGAPKIMADQAIEIARHAMPNATVSIMLRPLRAQGSYAFLMRVPEETSEAVHSVVTVDQYSGKVLHVGDFTKDSLGYRVIRFNRSIHTGDVFGFASHILLSLVSLLMVAMVITGLVIWWKKLAV
jgi:uncharacterized iron-regulated membrane protein